MDKARLESAKNWMLRGDDVDEANAIGEVIRECEALHQIIAEAGLTHRLAEFNIKPLPVKP